jgi:hypothetical protein
MGWREGTGEGEEAGGTRVREVGGRGLQRGGATTVTQERQK